MMPPVSYLSQDFVRLTARRISSGFITRTQQSYSRFLLRLWPGCRAVPPLRVPCGFLELALRLEDVCQMHFSLLERPSTYWRSDTRWGPPFVASRVPHP